MNITSGALKRLAHVVLACALVQIALRADAAMADFRACAGVEQISSIGGICPRFEQQRPNAPPRSKEKRRGNARRSCERQ